MSNVQCLKAQGGCRARRRRGAVGTERSEPRKTPTATILPPKMGEVWRRMRPKKYCQKVLAVAKLHRLKILKNKPVIYKERDTKNMYLRSHILRQRAANNHLKTATSDYRGH